MACKILPIKFAGGLVRETDKAVLVYDGQESVWLPKSEIYDKRRVSGDDFEFLIPQWLAEKKGII